MYEGWKYFTPEEIIENKKSVCAKCHYFSAYTISGNTNWGDSTCDFISIEKRARGCLPNECVEKGIFKPKKKKRGKRNIKLKKPWV